MNEQLPAQVEGLIESMNDMSENVYIRSNYRQRADAIRSALDKAIKRFDTEYELTNNRK
jgi:hypothetical protein